MTQPRPTLVLADDHELLLEGLEALLRPRYDIIARANNGEDLVTKAVELQPDVVVSDVSMPKLDGLAATHRIRSQCPRTRIVLVSMRHDPATARQALHMGASAYVLKTEASQQLVAAIEKALEGGTYIGPALKEEGAAADERVAALTERQVEVLRALGEGMTMKAIGAKLNISPRTVAFHKYRIMEQLGIETNAELLRYVHSLNLIDS